MPPRKKSQASEVITPEEGMKMILDTPVQQRIDEAAAFVGVAEIRLLEMFSERLNLPEAMGWESVPLEYEPLLTEFKNQVEAFNSVRVLESDKELLSEATEQPVDPSLPEEKPSSKRKGKKSTALTQRKSSKLQNSDENSQQLASTDLQVKEVLHARKGQKSGARLATIELLAEDSTYRKIKGEGLIRKVAQLTQELTSEADFDPIATLQELGIDTNSDLYQDLREHIEPALGKVESATAEIVDTAWVNGIALDVTQLENLLNSSDY